MHTVRVRRSPTVKVYHVLEKIQNLPQEQTEKLTLTRLVLCCKTQVWPAIKPILTDPSQQGMLELRTLTKPWREERLL